MREIEFRGQKLYGREAGKWVYGSLLIDDSQFGGDAITYQIYSPKDASKQSISGLIYVDGNTAGQYTGMKDSEGTKVYEGDIFEALHDFGPGGFHKRIGSVGFHIEFGYQWNYWDIDNLVVIGNIHENPELLTKENGK